MPGPESRLLSRKLSRRRLLGEVAAAITGGAVIAAGIEHDRIEAPLNQWVDWKNAEDSNDTFLERNQKRLKNLTLGCSFAPEELGFTPQDIGPEAAEKYENVKQAMDILIDDLGITEFRFGVRWANAVKTDPKTGIDHFDFSFYKPFVDYLIQKGANVCLNIGPIKTFRDPEEHVPKKELQNVFLPGRGQRVTSDMVIAKKGVAQLMEQLDYVADNYPGQISAFQPDNEPEQSTGQFGWVMDKNYLMSNIELIHTQFPDAQILVNASDPDNVGPISSMFKKLITAYPSMRDHLVLGYDYYYKKPKLSDKPVIGYLDPITRAQMKGNQSLRDNKKDAKRYGYAIEVTEGQFEKWGPYVSPGNDIHEFRFMLERCMDEVLDMNRPSLLRLWGVESLAWNIMHGGLTEDRKQIIDLIKRINPQKPKLYVF
ncbi:MAG: hypothetical protein ACM3IJ_03975 [Candidatus Levyibacteriota bacterium]